MKLRELLDKKGIDKGSDTGLLIRQIGGGVMNVSRRYLECPVWADILDSEVVCSEGYSFVIE